MVYLFGRSKYLTLYYKCIVVCLALCLQLISAEQLFAESLSRKVINNLDIVQKTPDKKSHKPVNQYQLKAKSSGFNYFFSGYVKLDAIYDLGPLAGDRLNYAGILSNDEDNNDGHFRMHARESRISLTASKLQAGTEIKIYFEGDFYSGGTNSSASIEKISNSNGLRLRQAYVQVGRFMMGQSWSNYVDLKSFPENLDFSNDTGQAFLRQAQLRYTRVAGDWTTSYSIENPESDIAILESGDCEVSSKDALPDITAKIKYASNWGHLSLQSLLRNISINTKGNNCSDSESHFAYGLGISGKLLSGRQQLRFHFSGGNGIGRYIQEAVGSSAAYFSDRSISEGTWEFETQYAHGGYIGLQHKWNKKYRSNLNTGFVEIDWDLQGSSNANMRKLHSFHLNLIRSFASGLDAGIEYSRAEATNDIKTSDIHRIQLSMKYKF